MKKTSAAVLSLLLIVTVAVFPGCFQASPETSFDLIIKGGRVYDGTSGKPRIADIGIKGDKIAAVGNFTGQAAKTISAAGLIVTPGFIDVHSQTDLILQEKGIWRILAYIKSSINGNHNYLYQGVTSIVTGNDSRGYTNTAKWLGWSESLQFGVNVCHLAPAGAIRNEIFSSEALKPLEENERNILKKRLLKEMDNGAIGISFDLSHNPDKLLTREELADIAASIKPYGGIISLKLRNTSGRRDASGNPAFVSSLQEVVEIARLSQTPIEISVLKLTAPWKNVNSGRISAIISSARQEGIDITADQSPYDVEVDVVTGFLPPEYVTDNYEIKKEYTTAEGKNLLLQAIDKLFTFTGPEEFLIVSSPADKFYLGKTIRQIAVIKGKPPAHCFLEMALTSPQPLAAVFAVSDRFAKKIMPSPFVFTASEGLTYTQSGSLPHPGYWGAFSRKLRKYALEDKIVHFNDAIRSMTALPAEKFKLRGRGQIAVGFFADIAVIDLKKIKDKATFLQPEQYAAGVEYLIVNGILSLEKGEITGKKGGRPLKRI